MLCTISQKVPSGTEPSYPSGNLFIFYWLSSPLSLFPTPSLCFLGTSSQILTPKSLIHHLLGRVPKLGHFQNSGPIIASHAPLGITNLNCKLHVSRIPSFVALFFLCLLPRSPSSFHLFFVCLLLRTSPGSLYFMISTKNDCSTV